MTANRPTRAAMWNLTGAVAGDEVAQLYLSDRIATVTRPVHWLAGCVRLTLTAGQSRRVTFRIEGNHLELWSREKSWVVETGEYSLSVGGGQQGQLHARIQVLA